MHPKNIQSALIFGESFDYILFRTAISFAESGQHVWFISPKTFNDAPKNINPPDKEILQLITFMYLKNCRDLVTQLNTIHLWRKVPNVLIVTGFEIYCNLNSKEYNPLQTAFIVTSLLDSAGFCAKTNNTKSKLLVTCCKPLENYEKNLQVIRDLYFRECFLKDGDDEHSVNILLNDIKFHGLNL